MLFCDTLRPDKPHHQQEPSESGLGISVTHKLLRARVLPRMHPVQEPPLSRQCPSRGYAAELMLADAPPCRGAGTRACGGYAADARAPTVLADDLVAVAGRCSCLRSPCTRVLESLQMLAPRSPCRCSSSGHAGRCSCLCSVALLYWYRRRWSIGYRGLLQGSPHPANPFRSLPCPGLLGTRRQLHQQGLSEAKLG